MADKKNLVMEERKEFIISPIDRSNSFLRTGHFLTPSINAAVAAPFTTPHSHFKDLPFQVNFYKLKYPTNQWELWVHRMCSLHHLTWKNAGIYDAIMSSTSIIHRNTNLIFGFVEKWCPATNSFVFPWGEATVTLEDMVMLGGYSVLGEDSVLITPRNSEMEKTVKKLLMERSEILKTRAKNAHHCVDHNAWMTKFMDSESEIEHEAFLAYWLSRFVFPMYGVGISVLSVAVHLARGIRIALAPAVLAGIYQDMSLLKATMIAASKIGTRDECDRVLQLRVSAPLALVQVWIWERFPTLRPNPNSIRPREPRMGRWHNLRTTEIEDLSRRIDSAAEIFEWRPYMKAMNRSFHRKIYIENEYRVLVDTELDEGFEGLVRCLRTSELVGLEDDCIEQYLPHRVAMQFGMDQDIPGYVARVNATPEVAWSNYTRPIGDATLYVPPRLFEPGVTARYLKWWKEIKYSWKRMNADGVDEKSSFEDSKLEVKEDSTGKETDDDDLVSSRPGFSPKRRRVESWASGNAGIPGMNLDKKNANLEGSTRKSPLYSRSNGTEAVQRGKCRFRSSEIILIESDSSAGVPYPPGFSPKLKRSSGESGISKLLEGGRNANSVPQQVSKRQISSSNGSKTRILEKGSFTSLNTVFIESSTSTKSKSRAPASPPGFAPKHFLVKTHDSGTGNVKRVAELSTSKSYKIREPQDGDFPGQIRPSSTEDNGNFQDATSLLKPGESKVKNTLENEENEQWIDGLGSRNETLKIGVISGFVESRLSEAPGVTLEERVKNIEKLCAWLKTGKLSCILIKKLNK